MGKLSREQYLLIKMMEECNEVAQRCSKALTFGIDEIQEGQELTNAERIHEEWLDLLTIRKMLGKEGVITMGEGYSLEYRRQKVEKWLEYSRKEGIIE